MAFISLATLKKHLRVSGTSEDILIEDFYYPAAIAWIEDYTGRELEQVQKTYTTTLEEEGEVVLPAYPVQAVDTYSYSTDNNGVATVQVSGHDTSEPLTINFTVGYADDGLPAQLKQAILFLVGHFFHNRSEVDTNRMADVPEGAKRLCDPFRMRTFAGV